MGTATDGGGFDALNRLSHLVDPVRRRLYEFVTSRTSPVTREEAAAATGITRTLAAYHHHKLTGAGLIEAGTARPEGRGGPGAGRPAKRYARADRELSVTLPARSYLLMADVLADAVAEDDTGSVRAAAARAARRAGRAVTDAGPEKVDLETALVDCGYEPARTDDGDIELRNCPFHQLSETHTELVCGLNLDMIQGVLEGAGEPEDRAVLCPREGRCCVVIRGSATP
jgi:predicted ArsR family transcriptional regulator